MRRSAAPSQLLGNSAKKPRFMPPGKANTLYLKKEPGYSDLDIEVAEVKEKQQNGSTFVNTSSSACGFSPITSGKLDRGDAESWHSDMGVKSVYKTKTAGTGAAEVSRQQEKPSCLTKYFSAVWCKISKKKHKKWEGDAVVIVKGKSAVLKDMEGKVIGRGTGYKAKDLENLDQGQTLKIGGKEIEVLGVIQEEDFKSGRCFQAGGETLMETPNFSQSTVKPFCNPLKNVCQTSTQGNLLKGSRNCKPRHDPCAPSEEV